MKRRIEDIPNNITEQLRQKVIEFSSYSLAVDESIHSIDTAQVLMFVRGIDNNFNTSGELAGMQSMQGRTTGKNICSTIIDYVTKSYPVI